MSDEKEVEALMFKFGPLHEKRFEIEDMLQKIPLQTGDILYRASNAIGPLGIPFSRLVAHLTDSDYSHAAIVKMVNGIPFVLEINDQGTLLYRMIDWLDTCYTAQFSVYRANSATPELMSKIEKEINKILLDDPDYDFTFSDPEKYYCTECVAIIYDRVGLPLVEPMFIKDIVSTFDYVCLKFGNFISNLFSFGESLSFDEKLYFVGNKKLGMISSSQTFCLFHYNRRFF